MGDENMEDSGKKNNWKFSAKQLLFPKKCIIIVRADDDDDVDYKLRFLKQTL